MTSSLTNTSEERQGVSAVIYPQFSKHTPETPSLPLNALNLSSYYNNYYSGQMKSHTHTYECEDIAMTEVIKAHKGKFTYEQMYA